MKAILRQTRISPKKVNLTAALARKKTVQEAIDLLKFTPKRSARVLRKLIESARANAENNFKQNGDELIVQEIIVTEGPTYKRAVPISRGRTHPILKRTSHITVKLGLVELVEPKEAAKDAPKEKPKKSNQ